jgi:hypothetical protein
VQPGELAPTPEPEQPAEEVAAEAAPLEEPVTAQVEMAPEAPAEEAAPKKTRRGRSRARASETEAEPTPAEQIEPPMEATVSAEHETREEIVAEAAEKPKRGGRRRKADAALQVEAPTAASAETEAAQEAILVEAEIEPGAQIPGELPPAEEAPPKKGRSRRKTAAQEAAASDAEEPAKTEKPKKSTRSTASKEPAAKAKTTRSRKKAGEPQAPAGGDPPEPPNTGVEIVGIEERGGNHYHTMRDLRNGQTVHNVTKQSARRLWLYAVQQSRRGEPEVSEVFWHPDLPIGVWRKGNRAGALRYDLVARYPDGSTRIFYGVTSDGLTGEWATVANAAEEAGYEGPEAAD